MGTVGDEMHRSHHSKSKGWTVHQDGADWWEGDGCGPISTSSVEKQRVSGNGNMSAQ